MKIKEFIEEWFPKTTEWDNVAKFILESGIEIIDEPTKWMPGYTNISVSSKPHHKDWYVRYMEESMFQLHDLVHQVFTMNLNEDVTEEEYVNRQIYGELFTFYLTEYVIPNKWIINLPYRAERGCYELMSVLSTYFWEDTNKNRIDFMWDVFINNKHDRYFIPYLKQRGVYEAFKKYSKMFKEDLEASRKNYKSAPLGECDDYCIVGVTSQNHIDFFEAVKKGTVKNIKREFNLTLPEEWN